MDAEVVTEEPAKTVEAKVVEDEEEPIATEAAVVDAEVVTE